MAKIRWDKARERDILKKQKNIEFELLEKKTRLQYLEIPEELINALEKAKKRINGVGPDYAFLCNIERYLFKGWSLSKKQRSKLEFLAGLKPPY